MMLADGECMLRMQDESCKENCVVVQLLCVVLLKTIRFMVRPLWSVGDCAEVAGCLFQKILTIAGKNEKACSSIPG